MLLDSSQNTFALAFVEAAPYLVRAKGKHFVVWIDGHVAPNAYAALAEEIAVLRILGIRVSVIIGNAQYTGKAISDSDYASLSEQALSNSRTWLDLLSRGWVGVPDAAYRLRVISGNFVSAQRAGVSDGTDQGHLGQVRSIHGQEISDLLDQGYVILMDGNVPGTAGYPLFVPSLELLEAYAKELKPDKVILCLPEFDQQNPQEWLAKDLQAALKTAQGPWKHTLECVEHMLKEDINRIHLVNGAIRGTIITELFSRKGSGILVHNAPSSQVVSVDKDELAELAALLEIVAVGGALVPRDLGDVEAKMEHFRVLKVDDRIVACGAIHYLNDIHSAVIEAIAVHPDVRESGLGRVVVEALEAEAARNGLQTVYLYTTKAIEWFVNLGYEVQLDAAHASVQAFARPERKSKRMAKNLSELGRRP